ncbi:MAG: ECF-type sigma factor [Planctomycetota bacterium]
MSTEITELLSRLAGGDRRAADELTPLVYGQLRAIASRLLGDEDARQFDATEIVHEAYLRLLGDSPIQWRDRAHFFATASMAIRRLLVDEARKRSTRKRGGGAERVDLQIVSTSDPDRSIDLIALDDALRNLSELSPRQAALVELRFFGGLTQDEAAETLGVSKRTVAGDWAMARAWLHRELSE